MPGVALPIPITYADLTVLSLGTFEAQSVIALAESGSSAAAWCLGFDGRFGAAAERRGQV